MMDSDSRKLPNAQPFDRLKAESTELRSHFASPDFDLRDRLRDQLDAEPPQRGVAPKSPHGWITRFAGVSIAAAVAITLLLTWAGRDVEEKVLRSEAVARLDDASLARPPASHSAPIDDPTPNGTAILNAYSEATFLLSSGASETREFLERLSEFAPNEATSPSNSGDVSSAGAEQPAITALAGQLLGRPNAFNY